MSEYRRAGWRWALHRATLAGALLALAPRAAFADVVAHEGASGPSVAATDDGPRTPEETWLEGRLRAPCCWVQTLDVHASPLADELRREVRRRLRAGESADAIEGDFAARFGERVRAVPKGSDPRTALALVSVAALVLALAAAGRAMRAWLRRGRLAAAPRREAVTAPDDAAYEARLDAELRALGD
ncbi:MAG: cytochrome c-type biogenesis protein CcmH [Polyangiaceae bacterium]|nr:cytochrome c-type biogenesis protein CcmH [Polyangiaceae bacterium]